MTNRVGQVIIMHVSYKVVKKKLASKQWRQNQSGWSGLGWTTSQRKIKVKTNC